MQTPALCAAFERHLETFREEVDTAQQYFFSYLGIRDLIAKRRDVFDEMNRNSQYWIVSHHAMIMSTFIAMGRIFDGKSKFNLGHLKHVVARDPSLLSLRALRDRKALLPGLDADEYVKDRHELTPAHMAAIGDEIDRWQAVYVDRYKAIRHQFAHKKFADLTSVNQLLANTDIEEMKSMFSFLNALHLAVLELWMNGLEPVVRPRPFVLPPHPIPSDYQAGEKAYRQAQDVIFTLMNGVPS
jgi:hypothetical protein